MTIYYCRLSLRYLLLLTISLHRLREDVWDSVKYYVSSSQADPIFNTIQFTRALWKLSSLSDFRQKKQLTKAEHHLRSALFIHKTSNYLLINYLPLNQVHASVGEIVSLFSVISLNSDIAVSNVRLCNSRRSFWPNPRYVSRPTGSM
jgi:hypothetical protein